MSCLIYLRIILNIHLLQRWYRAYGDVYCTRYSVPPDESGGHYPSSTDSSFPKAAARQHGATRQRFQFTEVIGSELTAAQIEDRVPRHQKRATISGTLLAVSSKLANNGQASIRAIYCFRSSVGQTDGGACNKPVE